ncbi:type II toxin-antitoxin system ParD family antitoxin [Methylobacterium sp. E-066]|uniref:type II toxin-antitoxin system ParD family antitoxin n=1 Tax=Methylobacterium sp. E-066 TaxID=2836584 RepID=UPI001FB950DC|nr:type II toxin-antitoxin system ParD family antitoxin [Methylobacterium sp. E-066]MCJ2138668.1 type II toxin-antitoxin system ParD family antitoxin [Methylobacterium sp. E-066]
MSATPTRCIALTKELEAYIRAQVASGRYTSASEVVRSALRLKIDREGAILGAPPVGERPETERGSV